ncbi:MAG: META domain-containing protein, partial [Pseudorhodobacter sp.]
EEEARMLSGSLTYRERIALPEGAEWRIEITGAEGEIATHAAPTEGRQVPLDFSLDAPEGPLVLRAAIFAEGRSIWQSEAIAVAAGKADTALGPVGLRPSFAQPFQSWLICGDRIFGLGFEGADAILSLGTEALRLPQQIAASGARFADAAGGTEVWTKGDAATIRWQGQEMPACQGLSLPPDTDLTARGNEPGWVLRLDADGAALSTESGLTLSATPLPDPDARPGHLRWTLPGLALTLSAGPCADSMSGMPYPFAAEAVMGAGALTGCAGDPMLLLQGGWRVTALADHALAGQEPPDFTVERGTIAGNSGCNRFSAALVLDGEGLRAGPAAVTRMACPPDRMVLEAAFLEALSAVDRFDIDRDGQLLLIAADREVIRAER